MNRLDIVNLTTGLFYAPVTDEDPATFMAARTRAYGYPERRQSIVDLENRTLGTVDHETLELVHIVEVDGEEVEMRRALAEGLGDWAWTESDGTEHPVRIDGDDIVSDAQHTVTVTDVTEELEAAEVASRRAAGYPPLGDQLDAIWKQLNYDRLNGRDLVEDADAILGKILAVKAKHPKKEKAR